MEITQELVKELFDYHEDGYLIWKDRRTSNVLAGDKAGSFNKSTGYFDVSISKKSFKLHRIIFLWHKGYLPRIVDHEDLNKLNNKISNLRAADDSQNSKNKSSRKGSTSKYLGVHFRFGKVWVAQIQTYQKKKYSARFKTEIEAALHYNKLAVKHHKEFANLNIIQL